MSDTLKYIVWDNGLYPTIIVFDGRSHADMAQALNITDKISSAGFVFNDKINPIMCMGRSTSLDIDSDPERDTILLRKRLGWDEEDL